MLTMFDVIAFDADDTLWHNETLYSTTQSQFRDLLARYEQADLSEQALYETEMGNLRFYGYGIKSFGLSMIETAIRLTGGRIQARDIQAIIDLIKEMLQAPVQLLEHVEEVIPALAKDYTLMLITKGDLLDQEAKIARSDLGPYFSHVEIVPDKNAEVYYSILDKHDICAERFLMVGNSVRSDILPVIAVGGHAVHVPYHITWAHETVSELDPASESYAVLEHLGHLPAYIDELRRDSGRIPPPDPKDADRVALVARPWLHQRDHPE
jgi:putative hydrolase of the HAD superfamily